MAEKRFKLAYCDYDWWAIREHKNEFDISGQYVVDLMNELNDENEKLKQQLRIYKNDGLETLSDLERVYKNNVKALDNIERLEKENKELKKQVDEMIDIFNDSGLDYHISDELEEILND